MTACSNPSCNRELAPRARPNYRGKPVAYCSELCRRAARNADGAITVSVRLDMVTYHRLFEEARQYRMSVEELVRMLAEEEAGTL